MADTVCDHVVAILMDWGVDTVFGLPGDGINGFVESLRRAKDRIRYIHCRHEEAAALAACGYAKFTGRLGVVFSTAAPGAVHLLNGLYDAKIDGAPVLAITGMTYHDLIGTHYLQDINQDYLFQDVAAYNQRLMAPEHVENVVNLACRNALARRAVAHVAIPIDIQAMAATDWKRFKRNVQGHVSHAFQTPRTVPERPLLEQAAKLLAGKKKVAILAGAGARGARSELEQVAERLGAPIVKALLGKECVPDDSPYTTGGIGVVGTRPSVEVYRNCDALLIVGSGFPYIEFLPKPGQAVGVQIDDKPDRIGIRYPVEAGLVGDAQATLRELLSLLPRKEDRSFLTQAQQAMKEWWALLEERAGYNETPMRPQTVAWHLPELMAPDAILCGDSGTVTVWQARMKLRERQRFSFSGTMCSMAAALPYAIGAQTAYPGPPGRRLHRRRLADDDDGRFRHLGAAQAAGEGRRHQEQHARPHQMGADALSRQPGIRRRSRADRFRQIRRGVRSARPAHRRAEGMPRAAAPGLAMDGPVLIECVVDPLEPPWPPEITRDEAEKLVTAMRRGERNTRPDRADHRPARRAGIQL